MSVDLGDFLEVLTREVNPAGRSLIILDDDSALGYLMDAFWEARLDGFLETYECDEDGVITATSGEAELPRQFIALIVIYAGIRILRNQILNTNTAFRVKGGPTEFERENSATMLAEMLKQLQATKTRLVSKLEEADDATSVYGFDAYSTRLVSTASYFGSVELTEL